MKKQPAPATITTNAVTASSNWKKLLPNIQKQQDNSKKRKASAAPESKRTVRTKRAKKTETTVTQEQVQVAKIPKKEDLWFGEDIDDEAFRKVYGKEPPTEEEIQRKKELVKEMDAVEGDKAKMGKYVAIDCEMVGVGPDGKRSALARVSIVNYFGAVLLDTFVKPEEKVTDYRTFVSGVTAKHLVNAMPYQEARQKVMDLIQDRVLVGHAILNDLRALDIHHPKLMIRDTSRYKPFRDLVKGKTPGLKRLVNDLLEIEIQEGKHSSVEDARFTMLLYRKVKDQWEKYLGSKYGLKLKRIANRIEKTEARRERREKQLENEKKKEQRKKQQQQQQ